MLIEGGVSMSFSEYQARSEECAAGLMGEHGIGAGSVVAWQLPTSIEAMVLMGALARLDAIQVPLIPLLRHREVSSICRSVAADLLVVPKIWRRFDHALMASEIVDELAGAKAMAVLVVDPLGLERSTAPISFPDGDPAVLPPITPSSDDAADAIRWIFHSSGTTAEPKGCLHTDASAMHSATGLLEVLGFDETDVYPIAYPLAHIGGITALTTQLVAGSQVALHGAFDPRASPQQMAREGASVLGSALPFFIAYIDAQREVGDEPLYPLLRVCVGGGAPKPPALHREVADVLGGAGILGSWGLTECPVATFGSPEDPEDMLARTEGRPVRGVEVRVDLAHSPVGSAEGELLVKGPQLFAGYVDSDLDAEAFTDDGFFRTGDLGVVHDSGHVEITGRLKDVIIRNAENLSALEIENVVRTHPAVHDVAVVGLPDARTGERACAVVVLADGARSLDLDELGEFCLGQGLAPHKRPEQLETIGELPRNALGKVLKRELVGQLRDGTGLV